MLLPFATTVVVVSEQLATAVAVLRAGGVVAHATEGVWGFACDVFAERAVSAVLQLKQRPVEQGLIVIAADIQQLNPELAGLAAADRERVVASWPGAVTWILPNTRFPRWITGAHEGVACRVPGHQQARQLCSAFGGPLVSTSANVSGQPPALTEQQAREQFAAEGVHVLSGNIGGAAGPSAIRTLAGATLRPESTCRTDDEHN